MLQHRPDEIKVFARGDDGALWVRGFNGAWSDWQYLGGQIAPGTAPAACSYGGRFDAFVRGTDGALWHKWYDGVNWSGWESLGGYLTSSPAAELTNFPRGPPGQGLAIEVIVRGGDGHTWLTQYYSGSWHGWVLWGNVL